MKIKWMTVFAVLAVIGLLFTGCEEPEAVDYTPVPSVSSVTIEDSDDASTTDATENVGTFTVTTNGNYTVVSDDTSIATVSKDGNTVTVTAVAAGSAIVTVKSVEDTSKFVDVPVTVNATTMVLTLNYSALTAKADVASVSVKYGNNNDTESDTTDDNYTDAAATVDTTNSKATVTLSKSYANSSSFFNGIVITLKNGSDETIEALWTNDSTDTSNNGSNWFKFNSAGVSMSAANPAYKNATLTLTFDGFTIIGGSATVTIGTNEALTATVATDGASATVEVSNQYANASGWFNSVVVSLKDSGGVAVENYKYDNYFEFVEAGCALTITVETDTYTKLVDGTSYTADGNLLEVAAASSWSSINASKIKIEVASVAGDGSWWFTYSPDTNWTGANLAWDDSISGYSLILTDATTISSIKTTGLYLAGLSGLTGTLTISYVSAE